MNIQELVRTQMKEAMRARDSLQTEVMRGLMSAFTTELLNLKRKPTDTLTDPEGFAVIKRLIKQRKDAAEQFTSGGRPELAEKENTERSFLEALLPTQASEAEIEKVVLELLPTIDTTDKAALGKLMGAVIKHFEGNADGSLIKSTVDRLLQK
jgi:uncharacterized protein YqeY